MAGNPNAPFEHDRSCRFVTCTMNDESYLKKKHVYKQYKTLTINMTNRSRLHRPLVSQISLHQLPKSL